MRKKYALCVGNNYPGTGADLNGCVNDAQDWAEVLNHEGYEILVMTEANKRSVMNELYDLVSKALFADRIVFTFSGHGTWMPDADGDEADGRDEALVMAGLSPDDLILDDELQEVFSHLEFGARALILSDSCHSGTISRFSGSLEAPGAADLNARRFLSPVELGVGIDFGRAIELERAPANSPRRTASMISGCTDAEYSWDAWFDGRANGAFTRAAIDTEMSGLSLGRWYAGIRQLLPAATYPQTPQLIATSYRKYTRAL